MKKAALLLLLVMIIATLGAIGMSCSRSDTPMQSTFAAEQGGWLWLQSVGGMNDELILVDSVDFVRALWFTDLQTVHIDQTAKGETFYEPDYTVGYSIQWEQVGQDLKRILRYENDFHAPQTMEFIGRDTLVLTDLIVNGYTHTYERF